MQFLLDHPVLLFVTLSIGFAAVHSLGVWDAQYFRSGPEPEQRAQVGTVQTALLGLLGLMLGFTFAMALSHFDLRRQLVIDEANSIGTTGLRASLLPDRYCDEMLRLLRAYVAARLEFYQAGTDTQRLEASIEKTGNLQQQMWSNAVAAAHERPDPITNSFVLSLNETIDLSAKRLEALENRIPPVVWWVLFLAAAVACFLTGRLYPRQRTFAVFALPLVLAAVLGLIADLDAPRTGLIRISQRSMMRLKAEHLYSDGVTGDPGR
ncbi:MAG TPA: hypothetical protein VMH37_08560 [Candidatus Binataceae bacterium]|nr:hypothetical protein [Candidatus Binataceae bacterium]